LYNKVFDIIDARCNREVWQYTLTYLKPPISWSSDCT